MVKKQEMRAAIDRVLARMDQKRAARRHNRQVASREVAKRRDHEKRMAKAALLRPKRKRVRRLELAGWKVLASRMAGDTWYDFGQLHKLIPEYARGSAKAWVGQGLQKRGLIERAGNPDFDPSAARGAVTMSRYVYRLSAAGQRQAAQWREACGMTSDTSKSEKGL